MTDETTGKYQRPLTARTPNYRQVTDALFVHLSHRDGERRLFSLVDAEDFDRVTKHRWFRTEAGYARITNTNRVPTRHQWLHAFIMRVEPGQTIDHINGDKLDNRKCNLRIAAPSGNAKNAKRPSFEGKTSKFKGVSWDGARGKWCAKITSDGAVFGLGFFDDEVEAAREYDRAAIKHHGEYARTNATMCLYNTDAPVVPDCSRGSKPSRYVKRKKRFDRPHDYNGKYVGDPLTIRLQAEIDQFNATGELPKRYRR